MNRKSKLQITSPELPLARDRTQRDAVTLSTPRDLTHSVTSTKSK